MAKSRFEGLSQTAMVAINNACAERYEGVKKVSRFRSKDDAMATLRTVLADTGEKIIRLLKPDYVKRGKAAPRFTLYRDGMTASEYVDACLAQDHPRGEAMRDLRYDANLGLISLV